MTIISENQKPKVETQNNAKSEDALKTISEVAKILDVPQHVLRFWEGKFREIKPYKFKGSRRYYKPKDVVMLTEIKDLLYVQGYTIKGVQKFLKERRANKELIPSAEVREVTLNDQEDDELQKIISNLRIIKEKLENIY